MESFHFLLSAPKKRTKSLEDGLKSPLSPTLEKVKRYTEKYSCFPFPWSRSTVSAIELHEPNKPDKLKLEEELDDEEEKFRAWINGWVDSLLEEGSPPWDEHGRNLPDVPVGWLPEEEWTPYEVSDFGEYPGECPW